MPFTKISAAGIGSTGTVTLENIIVTGNINSSGVSTFTTLKVGTAVTISGGIVTATSFVGDGSSLTGIAATTNVRTNSLVVSGVSTFSSNPVFIGSGTSTGTASQPLQVTGDAYVSGNIGIGTTTTQAPLDVIGNTRISGNLQFNSGYGSVATAYGCRAWVNFNGTGTVSTNQTIRASGNVSTVFKNGTGDYTVNFTTLMPDANYCFQGSCDATGNTITLTSLCIKYATIPTVGVTTISAKNDIGNSVDPSFCNVAIFR